MPRLSSPIDQIKPHYTVVVIGSGYGGAIAASRLARAGQRVCVLERGKEFQPGDFPDTEPEALAESQVDLPQGRVGDRTGLFDVRVNPDMNVLVGCGLGGTSLINANVSLPAEPRVFADPVWPEEIRRDDGALLAEGYRLAQAMLRPTPYPVTSPELPKLRALERVAQHMSASFYRPPINVSFEDGPNPVGVHQRGCNLCGDCMTGCNRGAKNTVLMNYLPDAKHHGAEIYTQVGVRRVERENGRWLVHYQPLDAGRERFDAPTLFVSADVVILAAGTLGSTEILLRSKAAGLAASDAVGHRFTGNGDVLAFAYNTDHPINGVGFGQRPENAFDPVGPCIAGIIDLRNQDNLEEGLVIEEGTIAGAFSALLGVAFATLPKLVGTDTDRGLADAVHEQARELVSLAAGAYRGAVRNTQTYLVMTHDDGSGRLYLEDDRLRVDWPGVGAQRIFERVGARLEEATRPLGGTYVRNPISTRLTGHDLITVHPLGGCAMAADAAHGAVNHKGQVFCGPEGTGVHDGLYVCDGAVVPRSLGVNPLLTISALAERAVALLARDRGWRIDYALPRAVGAAAATTPEPEPVKLGIQFTETMRGYLSTDVTDDFARAAAHGRAGGSSFEFTVTVLSDDLERMLADDLHEARIVGTVTSPALAAEPLTVTDGTFNLFVDGAEGSTMRHMLYRMRLAAEDGRRYYFDGFKEIHDGPGFDIWSDTTTLFITVHAGDGPEGRVVGKGILTIRPLDFARQMLTMRIRNAAGLHERLDATARFGRFFAGALYETYAGVASMRDLFRFGTPGAARAAVAATAEVAAAPSPPPAPSGGPGAPTGSR